MKSLVTGAAGFIGSHLVEKLLGAGHVVVGVDSFLDNYPRHFKESNLAHFHQRPQFTFVGADLTRIDHIDGNRLPQSPEWVFSMMTEFRKPVGSGEFFASSDIAYRSEVNFFLYESVEFEGKSLLETGLRIGYAWNDGKQEVAIFGRNLTDEIEAVGGIDFNNLTGFVNEPRRFGVSFRTSF